MLRALIVSLAAALPVALTVSAPAEAQIFKVPFHATQERTQFSGPYEPYALHVLRHSARRFEVLFKPGFVDPATAIRAVAPLCAQTGRKAYGVGTTAPAEVTVGSDGAFVLQAYRVNCQ